ncbi:unnamed protein product [Effrenium voratum]|uniref:AB hydrolase-1 domain-containing protein n=1 Tax=Effrenium voratum TaxID=2562239 RepID=A0AA36JEB8_9DINO|nr:unnamed protein product [Effrenium voratum]
MLGLICLFGAGTDATSFLHWTEWAAQRFPFIELLLLVLPGHGINRQIPLESDAKALARLGADELLGLGLSGDIFILGFSAGATAGLALCQELQSRHARVRKLYVAGRAGCQVRYRPPNHEEIWAFDPLDWARWFAANFATEEAQAKTEARQEVWGTGGATTEERLISLSDGREDGLLKSIALTQRVSCDLHAVASRADAVWPAERALPGAKSEML